MNYTRIAEILFVLNALKFERKDRILDISSPRFIDFYLAYFRKIPLTIADSNSYFVSDFEIYKKELGLDIEIELFDATKIPFPDKAFDKIFSISALEHIPRDGDIIAVKEIIRLLKPKGEVVITLPAHVKYHEEWLKEKTFYWKSEINEDGEFFYQRRYNKDSIINRFGNISSSVIKKIVFIAERPIKDPYCNDNGMLMHNAYFIYEKVLYKLIRKIDFKYIPLTDYFFHLIYSKKYHYLTDNHDDPNIRQVCVQFEKK